jgi:hypothetical protein
MKNSYLLAGALALLASQAVAAPQDTDGDGSYSMEEMIAAYPDLTEEQFADIDSNEDGVIDPAELEEAIELDMIDK